MNRNPDDATDIDAYLAANPEFRECRSEGHSWEHIDKMWIENYDDEDRAATHVKRAQCRVCGKIRRRRRAIRVVRNRAIIENLPMTWSKVDGWAVKGTRLTATMAQDWEVDQLVQNMLKKKPAPAKRSRRQAG